MDQWTVLGVDILGPLLPLTACGGEAAPDATCCTTVVNKLSALMLVELGVDPGDAIVKRAW